MNHTVGGGFAFGIGFWLAGILLALIPTVILWLVIMGIIGAGLSGIPTQ